MNVKVFFRRVTEHAADLHVFKISHKQPNNQRYKIIENSSTWSQKIQFISFKNHTKNNSMQATMIVPSEQHCFVNRDDGLTVHRSITLANLQLDAQNSYLFTCNRFIKILYMFRALLCSSSGGLRRNCIYAASGIVTVCR
jgi:hypothetical protein